MTLQFSGRWIPVTERLPDDDITVMLHQPARRLATKQRDVVAKQEQMDL